MQNILVFAGTKQSGKSSAAKYVVGSQLKKNGIIREFKVDENGSLLVNNYRNDADGKRIEGMGILDIYRTDFEFGKYASERIWPYCKVYSFATLLKEAAIAIFGLNPKNIYGSDEDKNTPTTLRWEDVASIISGETQRKVDGKRLVFLTHRELLQEFGTVCRKFKPDCWVTACYTQILAEGYPNVIIDDCRYENEVDIGPKHDAKTVLLERQPFKNDTHSSEKVHEIPRSKFNFVIADNLTLDEKHTEIDKILESAGWQTGFIS